jgi:hypothetical protein
MDKHKKNQAHHFGQVNLNMFVVIWVISLTGKVVDHLIGHFD